MKLNLGCGQNQREGYTNVDIQDFGDKSSTDVMSLEYSAGTIEEVYMSHLLEHLYHQDAVELLRRIYSWLQLKGKLLISVPDLTLVCRFISQGDSDPILWNWLYGADQDLKGMNHRWGYTRQGLWKELEQIGFRIIGEFTGNGDDSAFIYRWGFLSVNLVAVKGG